ncbi:HD-GYP domain-containing protein [Natranaerobius trueperi]|uniref:Phosphohydrolase n=1 Tax=Natranaerobius trueperi TaxID=759412 RepID=A0A226BZG6_9FIRM|nr:HD-GYP domain-containing protein [Natranaerobius trueperi]OWZ83520.1 phosphohydrolase [Natranaerobius trueperi]
MRLINVNDIQEGMILARPVYSKNGNKLLQEGATLKEGYVPKIKQLGYSSVYIQDKLLQDVEVNDLITEELRRESINHMKETFRSVKAKTTVSAVQVLELKGIVDKLLEDIISNKNLIVDMVDIKMYDEYTFHHCVNVAVLSIIVGLSMGFNQESLYKIGLGALLHDIGKVNVSNELINKKGKLTDEEFEVVKEHTKQGYDKLKENNEIPSTSKIIALQHHERVNGEGYPEGKNDDEIHIYSKIVAVADVFDAMTSDRPYRKGYVPSEVMEYILGGAGSFFDRKVVGHFFKKVAVFPIGTEVTLNDNRVGLVIENFEKFTLRPKLRIIRENDKNIDPYDLDLRENNNKTLTIVKTNKNEQDTV